jgi:hypothetical protein
MLIIFHWGWSLKYNEICISQQREETLTSCKAKYSTVLNSLLSSIVEKRVCVRACMFVMYVLVLEIRLNAEVKKCAVSELFCCKYLI